MDSPLQSCRTNLSLPIETMRIQMMVDPHTSKALLGFHIVGKHEQRIRWVENHLTV
jgi:hypothetical protein